jgi:hypothetical protein
MLIGNYMKNVVVMLGGWSVAIIVIALSMGLLK